MPRLLRLAIYTLLSFVIGRTYADPDLWGHVLFGREIATAWQIPRVDHYSFTSDIPWINHEWLAELVFARAYDSLGSPGLVLLKVAIIWSVAGLVWIRARRDVPARLGHHVLIALAVISTLPRNQFVRPQLFSLLLFAALLSVLRDVDEGRRRIAWFLPILFALWANLHGGWIVGLGVLVLWSLLSTRQLGALPLGLCALGAAGTLLNPYGVGLWEFIFTTVRPNRPDIADWLPMWAMPWKVIALNALLPAIACIAAYRAPRPAPKYVAIICGLFLLTLQVNRIDAFLNLSILLLMTPQIGTLLNTRAAERPQRRLSWLFAAGAVVTGLLLSSPTGSLLKIRIEGSWVPDTNALIYLREEKPGTRLLTWFDWGQYAIWHLEPSGIRVSMDGRRETVYSEKVTADHFAFYRGHATRADYPQMIEADAIWLPTHVPVIQQLKAAGWKTAFETAASIVLVPKPVKANARQSSSGSSQFFPGP